MRREHSYNDGEQSRRSRSHSPVNPSDTFTMHEETKEHCADTQTVN